MKGAVKVRKISSDSILLGVPVREDTYPEPSA